MTQQKPLTGPELETLGLMKFTCNTCRDIFPVRCDEHRVLSPVVFEGNHRPHAQELDHRKLELLVRLERVVPKKRVLFFGTPLPDYTAPYETLTAEIERIPLGSRD